MWKEKISLETNEISCEQVYKIISDVNNWNKWDSEIEWTKLDGEVEIWKIWWLKPKGWPKTKMEITDYKNPNLFVDVASLPFAKMKTTHHFEQVSWMTKISFEIEITGFLSFLWKYIIWKEQIQWFEKQISNIINYSKTLWNQ